MRATEARPDSPPNGVQLSSQSTDRQSRRAQGQDLPRRPWTRTPRTDSPPQDSRPPGSAPPGSSSTTSPTRASPGCGRCSTAGGVAGARADPLRGGARRGGGTADLHAHLAGIRRRVAAHADGGDLPGRARSPVSALVDPETPCADHRAALGPRGRPLGRRPGGAGPFDPADARRRLRPGLPGRRAAQPDGTGAVRARAARRAAGAVRGGAAGRLVQRDGRPRGSGGGADRRRAAARHRVRAPPRHRLRGHREEHRVRLAAAAVPPRAVRRGRAGPRTHLDRRAGRPASGTRRRADRRAPGRSPPRRRRRCRKVTWACCGRCDGRPGAW